MLPSIGGAVTIRRLIIVFGDMLEGTFEYVGGSEALDDSPGPKVLALLAGGCCTELSRRKVVASSVVGGLLVSYLR